MSRLYSIAIHMIAFLWGFWAGWTAAELAHPGCTDLRFTGHRHWDLSVECRR